ncbi:hypothetical protein K493DRAFT_366578 [Basidiobolus meristosporus CBS 931.73]|uniref:Uncharacterized protein n=1 Tax=Basidiobolus meristosporus CBS 931.73 TaxID=1314790 RepID=A0A1Y1WG90_9FUNG|nr:hypothetical protein K493DRAFT_366578 [Basidiobolus meristosporus CBS 931.73]|eukprot:ORX72529.1 hypothetical protein K493DRAFT_366578 [Basidiobolus meristosporus CBS 931.73]
MFKQLTAACALLMAVSAFGSPVDVSSTNMASASISDRNPQSGQVVKRFSSNKEEDAQNIRHYIDGILGQMSRNMFDQTLSDKQDADQDVEEEEGDPEEAQLWGRYGGYGGEGADTGDEEVTVATVVMEVGGDMDATGDMEGMVDATGVAE